MKRWLQIIRDGHGTRELLTTPLLDAEQGNRQTLRAMISIVNDDRTQPDLRAFVLREIVPGVRGHDFRGELDAIHAFCRDRIVYRKDPVGVERVADLWSTMYGLNPDHPEGDCGIKSLAFATCAALLGHKPYFVVASQRPDQAAFDHVYNAAMVNNELVYFDATPEDKPAGWHVNAYKTFIVPIF